MNYADGANSSRVKKEAVLLRTVLYFCSVYHNLPPTHIQDLRQHFEKFEFTFVIFHPAIKKIHRIIMKGANDVPSSIPTTVEKT